MNIPQALASSTLARLTTERGRLYSVWATMIQRCHNPKSRRFEYYGARGIIVCGRWRASFENFLEDMGPRPSPKHEIDRHPDNEGGYEPDNCRWALHLQNGRNTRRAKFIEYAGERLCCSEWSVKTGIPLRTITWRLQQGWSPARILGNAA